MGIELKRPGWQITKRELIAQGIRYLAASVQDTHPAYGVTHASYARMIFEAMAYEGDYFPALLRKAGEIQEAWTLKILKVIPLPLGKAVEREMKGFIGAVVTSKKLTNRQRVALLKRMADEIEEKVATARTVAQKMGRDVNILKDVFGQLRMVFTKLTNKIQGSLIPPGYKEGRPLAEELTASELVIGGGAWPAKGFAIPTRGYLTRPHGYAAMPRTRIVPGG